MDSTDSSNKHSIKENQVVNDKDEIDFTLKIKNEIEVEFIDTDLYKSKELWLPKGARGVYGGQVVAQSLRAAWNTVPEDFFCHSLHAYFLLACNANIPVIYHVDRIRDGRSFATRIVTAKQNGKAIYVSSFSFAKAEEGHTLNHQTEMPEVADADTLPSDADLVREAMKNLENIPEDVLHRAQTRLLKDYHPIDYRRVGELSHEEVITGDFKATPHQKRWFKSKGVLDDDWRIHACVMAYASDSGLLNTATIAKGTTYYSNKVGMMASIDHVMWFHEPTRADEWLLYDTFSPYSNNDRGMAFGRIYSQDGTLVATTAQEGIIRLTPQAQEELEQKLKQELSLKLNKL